MRTSFQAYTDTIAHLHTLMESVYKQAGARTRKAASNIRVDSSCRPKRDRAVAIVKSQLAGATELAYPKPGRSMCLFTDASETHWTASLTQIPSDDSRTPIKEQRHEPLSFLSGVFKGSTSSWRALEKKGYAIWERMGRMDYLIAGRTIYVFSDHANLVYLLDPYGQDPGLALHNTSKLMRRANEAYHISLVH